MAFMQNIGIFKVLGLFGTILLVGLFLGGSLIGLGSAIKTGDWSAALESTGGRIFAIDKSLNDETDYLLNPDNTDTMYLQIFHVLYGMTLIFMLFFVAFLLFRIGNWMMGIKQWSPSSDIILGALIIIIILLLQFLYTYYILDESIIPMSGVWRFSKNLPSIINNML